MKFNLKDKIKNYGFWVSLTGAVILVLEAIGGACGFTVDNEAIVGVVSSIAGLLVVLGIVSNPTSGTGFSDLLEESKELEEDSEDTEVETETEE